MEGLTCSVSIFWRIENNIEKTLILFARRTRQTEVVIGSTQLLYLSSKMPSISLNCFALILQLLSFFSQQPNWRRDMSLASHAQGLRSDPHQRHTCHIFSNFFFTYFSSDFLITVFKIRFS